MITLGDEHKATGTVKFTNTTKTQLNADLNCLTTAVTVVWTGRSVVRTMAGT